MTREKLQEIKERVDAAEQEGWYGYDKEAIGDARLLIAEVERNGGGSAADLQETIDVLAARLAAVWVYVPEYEEGDAEQDADDAEFHVRERYRSQGSQS